MPREDMSGCGELGVTTVESGADEGTAGCSDSAAASSVKREEQNQSKSSLLPPWPWPRALALMAGSTRVSSGRDSYLTGLQ